MSRLETSILLGAAVILAVAVPVSAADRYKGFERAEALITVQELKQLSDAKDPKLVILGVVEPMSFGAGHIPGSINIWRPDYELKVGQPYPFEGVILDRVRFQDFARSLGIDNDSRVAVYDEKYDATSRNMTQRPYGGLFSCTARPTCGCWMAGIRRGRLPVT